MAISNPGFNFPILSRVLCIKKYNINIFTNSKKTKLCANLISPMFKVILFLIDSVISESEILFSVKIISYGANPAFRAMAHSPGETLSILFFFN